MSEVKEYKSIGLAFSQSFSFKLIAIRIEAILKFFHLQTRKIAHRNYRQIKKEFLNTLSSVYCKGSTSKQWGGKNFKRD